MEQKGACADGCVAGEGDKEYAVVLVAKARSKTSEGEECESKVGDCVEELGGVNCCIVILFTPINCACDW